MSTSSSALILNCPYASLGDLLKLMIRHDYKPVYELCMIVTYLRLYNMTTIAMTMRVTMISTTTPPAAPPAIGPTDVGLPLLAADDET